MKKLLYLLFPCTLMGTGIFSQVPVAGASLPGWQKGYLDLHHINTGRQFGLLGRCRGDIAELHLK